ncbi:hypothetical protein LEP3755_66880 (plasmid) [Leptolyngbya sp. NIES-3755]|nr:hypothetical protein LEP3755_66880 [Leptolyngbya sp. NIES-3755]
MTPFTLDLDDQTRDTLIFGEPLDWSGEGFKRRATFDHLSIEQLEQLIARSFVDGDDQENLWIPPRHLIAVARSPTFIGLKCYFEGFVASGVWEQPVALSGICIEGCVSRSQRREFYHCFEPAATIELSSVKLRATWTWGVQMNDLPTLPASG